MTARLDIFNLAPEAYKGLGAVKNALRESGLPRELLELVNLRVSQINGCAYCIDMHSRDLLTHGVSIDKVVLVPVWREAEALFTDKERAALAWAESVTRVADTNVPDADYQQAAAVLGQKELADLTMAVALMNAFNRIGVGMRLVPAALAG
ncbi:MAG TPA: carboxymuconolactone decarboxylase family protein [Duganella sp.]|nr:carboxymuconolactone decarboxylase family protein [Duganella sp.]